MVESLEYGVKNNPPSYVTQLTTLHKSILVEKIIKISNTVRPSLLTDYQNKNWKGLKNL